MTLEIATGSILGRDHLLVGKNNQDSSCWFQNESLLIAVVADGCSSGNHSEFGAVFGSKYVVRRLAYYLQDPGWSKHLESSNGSALQHAIDLLLAMVRGDTLDKIAELAKEIQGQSFTKTIENYFLFTIVGTVVTPRLAFVFNLGDGVVLLNGHSIPVEGNLAHNTPAYMAYDLIQVETKHPNLKEALQFRVPVIVDNEELESLVIASDGLNDLIAAKGKLMPGKEVPIGDISELWTDDRFYGNPVILQRHLNLINREVMKPDWGAKVLNKEVGYLRDDTTLICIRRKA